VLKFPAALTKLTQLHFLHFQLTSVIRDSDFFDRTTGELSSNLNLYLLENVWDVRALSDITVTDGPLTPPAININSINFEPVTDPGSGSAVLPTYASLGMAVILAAAFLL